MTPPNQGKRGNIIHIYRDILFLHTTDSSQVHTTDGKMSNIFIERARNVAILGGEMITNNNRQRQGAKRHDWVKQKLKIQRGEYKGQTGICL